MSHDWRPTMVARKKLLVVSIVAQMVYPFASILAVLLRLPTVFVREAHRLAMHWKAEMFGRRQVCTGVQTDGPG